MDLRPSKVYKYRDSLEYTDQATECRRRVIFSINPEFSEEARQAKLGGICLVGVIVDTNGVPQICMW
jgi:hypothetical protein